MATTKKTKKVVVGSKRRKPVVDTKKATKKKTTTKKVETEAQEVLSATVDFTSKHCVIAEFDKKLTFLDRNILQKIEKKTGHPFVVTATAGDCVCVMWKLETEDQVRSVADRLKQLVWIDKVLLTDE